jgi:hypothetical protein
MRRKLERAPELVDTTSGDVGFYMRLPVMLDRRLRLAVASRHAGYIPRGKLGLFVQELIKRGLDELEPAKRKRQLELDGKGQRKPSRPRKRGRR